MKFCSAGVAAKNGITVLPRCMGPWREGWNGLEGLGRAAHTALVLRCTCVCTVFGEFFVEQALLALLDRFEDFTSF